MRLRRRSLVVLASVGVLVLAAGAMGWSLRAPDPRTRGAWAPGPVVLPPATPVAVELYVPSCDIDALRIAASPGSGGTLRLVGPAGDTPGARLRLELAPGGHVDVPVRVPPARERIVLTLTALDGGVTLDDRRPFRWLAAQAGPLGLLPCAVAEGSARALLIGALLVHLAGLGWLTAVVLLGDADARSPSDAEGHASTWRQWPRWGGLTASAIVTATVLVYAVLVPPFEPPDELAHVQYARFIATTGTLPRAVPAPGSEWRDSAYEWVQQPGYYLIGAALLAVAGDAAPAPAPAPHPHSRLHGGPDVSLYRHPDVSSPPGARRSVWLLRLLSAALAALTIWCTARAVALATGDSRLGAMAAASVALVPQWTAVMGSASTDPPATAAAAVATWLLCRWLRPDASWGAALLVGIASGLAYAMKVTAVFLVPMLAVALLAAAAWQGGRVAARHALACGAGLAAAAAWIPLRAWLVFGDPLARAFKRDVLAIGGFAVTEGPPLFSVQFLDDLRRMVFEPFWARFGSLGAGPLPGTRLWWIYGLATCLLVLLLAVGTGLAIGWAARAILRRRPLDPGPAAVLACTVGVGAGVGLWVWVNLVPQADVIVHWTPRHILPLTAPLLVVTAAAAQTLVRVVPSALGPVVRPVAATGVLVLAVTGLAVMRSVVLGFHFGF